MVSEWEVSVRCSDRGLTCCRVPHTCNSGTATLGESAAWQAGTVGVEVERCIRGLDGAGCANGREILPWQ